MKKIIAVAVAAVLMSPAAFAATAPAHTQSQFFNRLLGQAVAKLPPRHHQPQPFVMQSRSRW